TGQGGGPAEWSVPPVPVTPPPPAWSAPRRLRFSVRRLRWRGWTVIALVVAVLAGAGDLIALEVAPTLQGPGGSSWWGPDRTRAVVTDEITGESVSAAPGRWGQEQGFVVTVTNPSGWTQTILGPVPYMATPGGVTNVQIGMSGADPYAPGAAAFPDGLHFSYLPGSIPPHQTRALRVLWTTTTCQDQGGHTVIYGLELRVRVGWVTRTEVVPLSPYFTLTGASPQRYCSG
ncbi:MAG: hypothetical protein J2P27_03460, partial [Actinobacteria bacterium]|nr:hypothetical protein [Actinomycetota bacterium]